MTAFHSFLVHSNKRGLIFFLSLISFTVSFLACIYLEVGHVEIKTDCKAPFNYYEIHRDGKMMIIKGVYYNFPTGRGVGKLSFSGAVTYRNTDGRMDKENLVSRFVDYKIRYINGRFVIETLSAGHQLGDSISNEFAQKYIFPGGNAGQQTNTSLFLINGKVLASGPAKTPRIICY